MTIEYSKWVDGQGLKSLPVSSAAAAAALSPSDNGPSIALTASTSILHDPSIEVDAVTKVELRESGFRSTRRTKVVCTIGPNICSSEQLEALASGGMNVARIDMCHNSREWHRRVIGRVRRLNREKGYAVAIMMDTEGSEIQYVKVGDELLVDGGMVRFEVIEKVGSDVKCRCTDPGLLLPRANLTFWRNGSLVRERNAMHFSYRDASRDFQDLDAV
ncbi:hypothetical protein MLD38_038172 [Melastoma candidum]|uniref:Uncharacterized protein n=1 Tax=Melastoma candidum TaxID=119954 RepID=A0ACB9KYC0_9MYRT|nr:hypothetical protein MLD38_038172 [Melastoma candidum]